MVDLSVIGVFAREGGDMPLLMLHPHGSRKVVCLHVSPVEALAVSMALKERANGFVSPSAPTAEFSGSPLFFGLLSHELMARLVEALGGRLLAVELPRMDGQEFTAELVLKTLAGFTRLGCRPADALALALRCGAMIRMPKHLLAHAEDADSVMNALSEYTRAVIEGNAPVLPRAAHGGTDVLTVPPEVEAALANTGASDLSDPRRNIINAAKKILEQQGLRENLEKLLAGVKTVSAGQTQTAHAPEVEIKLVSVDAGEALSEKTPGGVIRVSVGKRDASSPGSSEEVAKASFGVAAAPEGDDAGSRKGPRIRVALVRQHGKGEAEVLEEFQVPAEGIPKEVLASLGLSRSEAEALGRESSDDDRWAMLLRMLSPETKVPM